jgi:hypothetical protein
MDVIDPWQSQGLGGPVDNCERSDIAKRLKQCIFVFGVGIRRALCRPLIKRQY